MVKTGEVSSALRESEAIPGVRNFKGKIKAPAVCGKLKSREV